MTLGSGKDDNATVAEIQVDRAPSAVRKKGGSLGHVLISGVGFLADAYDLFVIDFVLAILHSTSVHAPTNSERVFLVAGTLAGAVIGQLFFGVAADFIGRRLMFITTAALVITGSVSSSLVGWGYNTHALAFSVYNQLAICRFLLGVGIGGEYPLSATVASENESLDELEQNAKNALEGKEAKPDRTGCWYLREKPNSIAAVFSMQGIGMMLSPLFVMLCIASGASLEATWRLALGIGAVPSAVAFFFRWKMHETAAFSKTKRDYSMAESSTTTDSNPRVDAVLAAAATEVSYSPKPAPKKRAQMSEFGKHLNRSWAIMKQYRWVLLGTSATWFLIDVTLYGTGSFKSVVVGQWFDSSPKKETQMLQTYAPIIDPTAGEVKRALEFPVSKLSIQREMVQRLLQATPLAPQNVRTTGLLTDEEAKSKIMLEAEMASYVALMAIPGYFLSLFLIHRTGLKALQFWGFLAVALVFIVLGVVDLSKAEVPILTLILFGFTFLCSNFGPNTTTFIMPTQLYPTLVRATCHGFSAAMGKLGGVFGTSFFATLEKDVGLGWLLVLCGMVSVVGAGFTLLIPGDKKARVALLEQEIELAAKAKARQELAQGVACAKV